MDWANAPKQVRELLDAADRDLKPQIENTAVGISLWDKRHGSDPMPEFCLEVGYLLCLGKPLLVLEPVGEPVPAGLRRAADLVVSYDPRFPLSEQPVVTAEIKRFHREHQ